MNGEIQAIRQAVQPLTGASADYDALLERCRNARIVLIGESTHGTHEFYSIRAEITQRLIAELGFHAVAVEADWPDSWRVNRFVRGMEGDKSAIDSLGGFKRFPQWMWRNSDVLDFIGWLREHNDSLQNNRLKAGFHGLDLYSLHESIREVLEYLEKHDPAASHLFAKRYSCFEHFGGDSRRYGLFTGTGISKSCEEEVVSALAELRRKKGSYLKLDGEEAEEDFFQAEQNATVVANAENYYRTMLRGDVKSWNLRDRHMMDTLLALMTHLNRIHECSRVVVWAHNSHVGNALATQMGRHGEFNLGQLCREHFGDEAVLVGFTTFTGTVTAASEWDGPAEHKSVRPALSRSYEMLFHHTGMGNFWLDFQEHPEMAEALRPMRLQRAIGVVYHPETERQSHYFAASLPDQFDGIFHIDETRAVEPLERTVEWVAGEVEETYPSGL
jgi:erythromycin esterase-like protein